jgi:hypothetical protein
MLRYRVLRSRTADYAFGSNPLRARFDAEFFLLHGNARDSALN